MESPFPVPGIREALEEAGTPEEVLERLVLLRESGSLADYVSWDEVRPDALPRGVSRMGAWGAIQVQRRANAVKLPFSDARGRAFRLVRCCEIEGLLYGLLDRMDDPSGVVAGVWNGPDRSAWAADARIREAAAIADLSGFPIGIESAEGLVRTGRRPGSIAERIVASVEPLLASFASVPPPVFTLANLRALYGAVADPMTGSEDSEPGPSAEWLSTDAADVRMRAVCDFMAGSVSESFVHPVLRAILVSLWAIVDPFVPTDRAIVARMMWTWAMSRAKCGQLALAAVSVQRAAEADRVMESLAHCAEDENDATYCCQHELRMMHGSLDELERRHERFAARRASWEQESGLFRRQNRRQQWLLLRAMENPRCEHTLAYHKREFDVVYETARTDLGGLVRGGLFAVVKQGRAQLFHPVSDLAARLRALDEPAARETAERPPRAPDDGLPTFF